MLPFDPSRLTPREKDELIRGLARVVEAQAARIAALEVRLGARGQAAAFEDPHQLQPAAVARPQAQPAIAGALAGLPLLSPRPAP